MKQTPFYYTLWRLLALSVMSLLTLATLSLTSCRHKDTEHDDYGLSAALSWADPADAGREIKDVRIWIFQAGGKLVAKRQYGSKFPVALDIHPLPVGEYDVVATTNLIEPFGAEGDETFSSLLLKLREASTSAEHAHYAVGHISLPRDRNSRIGLSLRRTRLETMVLNAADALVPSQKGAEGIWGRASNNKQPAQGKSAIEQNGLIKTETLRPMPTVGHDAYAYLRFTFRLADGSLRECAAEAPIMKPAGKYTLKMKYSELKPFMHIKPTRISDWEEGWTVVGEILNPDD